MKIEPTSGELLESLKRAECHQQSTQEHVRALWERAEQVRADIATKKQCVEQAYSVRDEILQAMLFEPAAHARLDRYNDEQSRAEREIVDLEDLLRKATETAKSATEQSNEALQSMRRHEQSYKVSVFNERCRRLVDGLRDELEELAFAAYGAVSEALSPVFHQFLALRLAPSLFEPLVSVVES